jgi:cytochrome c oxidase subunit 2
VSFSRAASSGENRPRAATVFAMLSAPFFRPLRRSSTKVVSSVFWFLLTLVLGLLVTPASGHAETRTRNMWWAPDAVTVGGHKVDQLLTFIFNLTGIVFVLVTAVYIYFLIKYRKRPGVRAVYSHGNDKLEAIWTLIPAAVFIGLAAYSNHLWKELRAAAPEDSLRIDIVAKQFAWFFRNPGLDGKLGAYDQKLLSTENTFGLVAGDPDGAGKDDYTSGELIIPIGRPVNVILRSQDVIHSFYVPEFRMYQDAVPGRQINWVWFTCDRIGNYQLACSQLCGSGHYNMKAAIKVVSQEDYEKLVKEKSKAALLENLKKQDAAKSAATAGPAANVELTQPIVAAAH